MDDDKIRVACADDNMAVRRVFRDIINDEPDMELVGEAINGSELISVIKNYKPHAVYLTLLCLSLMGLR